MPETKDTSTVTPTGAPLIPPAVVAWIALAFWIIAPVLVGLVQYYPENHALLVALLVVQSVASGLGIASPGLRRRL